MYSSSRLCTYVGRSCLVVSLYQNKTPINIFLPWAYSWKIWICILKKLKIDIHLWLNWKFPAKILTLSGSRTTANFKRFFMIWNLQLCVTNFQVNIFAGNLQFQNRNTVFISAFLSSMNFKNEIVLIIYNKLVGYTKN